MNSKEKCFICGNIADSKEHSIKRTDIKSLFGKEKSFKGEDALCLVSKDKILPIQGVNSNYIKFNVLCRNCNNTKTQPFDKAYEKFITYIENNKENILKEQIIDLSMVYHNWEVEQVNLYKYLIKSFCCRLSYFKHPIPEYMIDILNEKSMETELVITFSINMYLKNNDIKLVANGDIMANQSYIDGKNGVVFYCYTEFYSWLEINYYHNYNTDVSSDFEWFGNEQYIKLGISNKVNY